MEDTTTSNTSALLAIARTARTAFGWTRTADPVTPFDQPGFRYDKAPLMWKETQ